MLCAFLHLAPLLGGHAVLLREQFVEVSAVGEFELQGDLADGKRCFPQQPFSLLETEGHAVIKKAQTGAPLDDGIEVAPIVIQKPCQFTTGQPTIGILQQTADAQKEQAFGAAAQVHRGDVEPG